MHKQSNPSATVRAAGNSVLQSREDWRLARKAHQDLQLAGMPPTNLLLVGGAEPIRIVLDMLWQELREPIVTWRPGQPLELPSPVDAATLVLHDAGDLTDDEQHALLRWLDRTAGQVRVVSTASTPLWPRVARRSFNDALYYRLNTVCVDVKA